MRLKRPAGWRPFFDRATLVTLLLVTGWIVYPNLPRCHPLSLTETARLIAEAAEAAEASRQFFYTDARPPLFDAATWIHFEDDCRVIVELGFLLPVEGGATRVIRTQTTFSAAADGDRPRATSTITNWPSTVTLP